ncbi:Uncharacterised protein [uncultured archaeon]|nr:Uncharacterised protein [uncultured archaeon]
MEEKISSHEGQIACAFNLPKLFERVDLIKKLVEHQFEEIPEPDFIKKIKTEALPFPVTSPDLVKKNNTIIFYDEPKQVVGIKGVNFRDVFIIFQELVDILIEEYDVDFEEVLNFIEGVTIVHVKTDENAKKIIKDYFLNHNKFDEIFNEKAYISTLRIIPENRNISDRIWFDVVIEPLLSNPKKYFVRYAFRNSDINKFKDSANNIDTNIYKVISVIEGGT